MRSRAKKLIQGSVVVQLSKGSGAQATPSARLPMCDVRFFSRNSLAHARCDCIQETICEHIVMAVWGFEQAEISQPDFEQLTLQIRLPDGEQAQQQALPRLPAAEILGLGVKGEIQLEHLTRPCSACRLIS